MVGEHEKEMDRAGRLLLRAHRPTEIAGQPDVHFSGHDPQGPKPEVENQPQKEQTLDQLHAAAPTLIIPEVGVPAEWERPRAACHTKDREFCFRRRKSSENRSPWTRLCWLRHCRLPGAHWPSRGWGRPRSV